MEVKAELPANPLHVFEGQVRLTKSRLRTARCKFIWSILWPLVVVLISGLGIALSMKFIYIDPKNHYVNEERLTLCNVTGWSSDIFSDGYGTNTYFYIEYCYRTRGNSSSLLRGRRLYAYPEGEWATTELGITFHAPAAGASMSCWYQEDDPTSVVFEDIGVVIPDNPVALLLVAIIGTVLAGASVCILAAWLRNWVSVQGRPMWYPRARYGEYRLARETYEEARDDLINHVSTRAAMWTFLSGTHARLGANSALGMFSRDPLYDPQLFKIVYQFLERRDDLPVKLRTFKTSHSIARSKGLSNASEQTPCMLVSEQGRSTSEEKIEPPAHEVAVDD